MWATKGLILAWLMNYMFAIHKTITLYIQFQCMFKLLNSIIVAYEKSVLDHSQANTMAVHFKSLKYI